jgi:hypothetical protein
MGSSGIGLGNGCRTWNVPRKVNKMPGGGGSAVPNGPGGDFGVILKMQVGNFDPATVVG